MFTGIITAIGTISEVIDYNGDKTFIINTGQMSNDDLSKGDSVCVNGVCLTVIEKNSHNISVDISSETLKCTNFDECKNGTRVNLEKAMLPNTRFNGHLLSGHVDCVAKIVSLHPEARSIRYHIKLPEEYLRYVSIKGSISIDGVSLTINGIEGPEISINIIPHTLTSTIFSDYVNGSRVNVEVDIIARYLESLIKPYQ
jgi:riboflavin synthase